MRVPILIAVAISLLARTEFAEGFDLDSASRVEVLRVAPLFDKHYRSSKRFRESKLIAGPKRLSRSDAAIAARELESIYPDESQSNCLLAPRYGLRFQLPEGTLDVLLCPTCDEVEFVMDRVSDHVVRRCSMAKSGPELIRMLKRSFPNHPLRENEA